MVPTENANVDIYVPINQEIKIWERRIKILINKTKEQFDEGTPPAGGWAINGNIPVTCFNVITLKEYKERKYRSMNNNASINITAKKTLHSKNKKYIKYGKYGLNQYINTC